MNNEINQIKQTSGTRTSCPMTKTDYKIKDNDPKTDWTK